MNFLFFERKAEIILSLKLEIFVMQMRVENKKKFGIQDYLNTFFEIN
jgi:hypothetical protein